MNLYLLYRYHIIYRLLIHLFDNHNREIESRCGGDVGENAHVEDRGGYDGGLGVVGVNLN